MRHLAPCFNIQPCKVRNVHVSVKVPMIFENGSKGNAVNELGRWEEAHVSKVTGDDRFLTKKFLAWRPWFIIILFSTLCHMLRAQCKSTERNQII